MGKRTIRERLVEALLHRGCRQIDCRSSKYLAFTHKGDPWRTYFVGKAGGLRRGRTVSDSVSLDKTALRIALLKEVPE